MCPCYSMCEIPEAHLKIVSCIDVLELPILQYMVGSAGGECICLFCAQLRSTSKITCACMCACGVEVCVSAHAYLFACVCVFGGLCVCAFVWCLYTFKLCWQLLQINDANGCILILCLMSFLSLFSYIIKSLIYYTLILLGHVHVYVLISCAGTLCSCLFHNCGF